MTVAQIITLVVGILIAIFRNQLSSLGDKITAQKKRIFTAITNVIALVVLVLNPVFEIVRAFLYKPFDKNLVYTVFFYGSILIFVGIAGTFFLLLKLIKNTTQQQVSSELKRMEDKLALIRALADAGIDKEIILKLSENSTAELNNFKKHFIETFGETSSESK